MPTKLKAVKQKIISVSLGPEHAACLTEAGHIVTFGSNTAAQLGRGHSRQGVMPGVVSRYIHHIHVVYGYLHIYTHISIYAFNLFYTTYLHIYPYSGGAGGRAG